MIVTLAAAVAAIDATSQTALVNGKLIVTGPLANDVPGIWKVEGACVSPLKVLAKVVATMEPMTPVSIIIFPAIPVVLKVPGVMLFVIVADTAVACIVAKEVLPPAIMVSNNAVVVNTSIVVINTSHGGRWHRH